MLKAVTRQATAVDAKVKLLSSQSAHPISTAYFFDHHATPEDVAVMVTEEDFMSAHEELVPSVSAGELAHYEKVRAMFEGGRDAKESKGPVSRKGKGVERPASKGKGVDRPGSKGKEVERPNSKGKGKMGFQDGGASDDDDLY